jgi:hypothetical protein
VLQRLMVGGGEARARPQTTARTHTDRRSGSVALPWGAPQGMAMGGI